MSELGIPETILANALDQFLYADPRNAETAKLLQAGVTTGRLQDSEWLAKILSDTDDTTLTPRSVNEAPES